RPGSPWRLNGHPSIAVPSSTVTKHLGSAVRRIRWVTRSDGAQVAGENWSAIVRPCSGNGYQAKITTGDRVEFYSRDGDAPRTAERCRAWVRLRVVAAA